MLFQGSLVVNLVTMNISNITLQNAEQIVQRMQSKIFVYNCIFREHYDSYKNTCLEMINKARYRSYPVDFSILSDFSDEDLEGLMDLGIKYSGQSSYAEPEDNYPPTYQVNWQPRNLCEGFDQYSISHSKATSWATAIIMAAEASLRENSIEEKLSLKYVLKCLPEYHDENPNDVSPTDIIRFVSSNGLISEKDASLVEDEKLCSDEISTNYLFEVNQNIVPNKSGLKNLTAEGNPVIVLMALDLLRLRTANNVTGNYTYTGATNNPSLYGVMLGYDEEKWDITFNVVPCENIVLQLPITESETNANYAGIAGYSFSMKYREMRTPTPPAPGLALIRIEVHCGASSSGSGTLTFSEGNGQNEVLSLPLSGNTDENVIFWLPSHLLNMKLVGMNNNWSDDSYVTLSYKDGKTEEIKLNEIPSEGLFYHYSHGIINDVAIGSNCGDVSDALQNFKPVVVGDGVCGAETQFTINDTDDVIYIKIGNNNYLNVNDFVIDGKANLEFIEIGSNSFTEESGSGRRLGDVNKNFQIRNCLQLQSVEIGEMSFADYAGKFQLSNLPSLKRLIIGSTSTTSNNFKYGSFSINSIFIYLYESNY